MPRWLGRFTSWLVRRRPRLVRVHLREGPTLSGYMRGIWAGHYVLELAKLHETAHDTHTLDGVVEIPRSNVLFLQVLVSLEGVTT